MTAFIAWGAEHYGASITAFTLFAVLHSLGARESGKIWVERCFGSFFLSYFWRLTYCLLSFVSLYSGIALLHWGRNTQYDVWLFVYPEWLWLAIQFLHIASIIIIYIAFIQSDYLEFLGLKQAWVGIRKLAKKQADGEIKLFGLNRLVINGIYAWVRHPMLSGGLLYLLTSGPSINNLVYTLMYSIYMLIGGHYEERRLVRIFGDEYRSYQREVPAYIPRIYAAN